MPDRHTDPKVPARSPADLQDEVRRELAGRGLTIQTFVIACYRALLADPRGFMAQLDAHRPTPKTRGRPRRTDET